MSNGATIRRKNPGALEGVKKSLRKMASKEIAVGFPRGMAKAYPDGTPVIDVAAAHVFGVGVPRRDFMALAKPEVAIAVKDILVEIARAQDEGVLASLQNAAGQEAQSAIQKAIIELNDPPNSPGTIARKGSSNPLIDTGHMKNSVTYVVRDRSRK